jgi:hypothetical protein
MFACWFFFCFFGSFLILPQVSWTLTDYLKHWNVPTDLANAIGFSFFVPGVIVLMWWICVMPMTWFNLHIGIKWKQAKPGDVNSVLVGGVILPAFIIGLAWQHTESFEWKMAYSICTGVMFVVTFVCYWLLLRRCKR